MKNLFLLLVVLVSLSSCGADKPVETEYVPVLITRESLEKSIVFLSPEPIVSPSKTIINGTTLLIGERYKGVHVIDNTNPSQPINKGYIQIPGFLDMAIKGNFLYADNATDLVTIDISALSTSTVKVTKRIVNAFQEIAPPDGKVLPERFTVANRPANTVLVAWKK